MPLPRLTVDAVLKMATLAARKHADALPGDHIAHGELQEAIAATWELVKGRLGQAEAHELDTLITKLLGRSER